MNNMNFDTKLNIGFMAVTIILLLTLLIMSFVGDKSRNAQANAQAWQHEYEIPLEVWQEFQDCIEPHPSDAVCDSCWTAIIVNKYQIVNSHE